MLPQLMTATTAILRTRSPPPHTLPVRQEAIDSCDRDRAKSLAARRTVVFHVLENICPTRCQFPSGGLFKLLPELPCVYCRANRAAPRPVIFVALTQCCSLHLLLVNFQELPRLIAGCAAFSSPLFTVVYKLVLLDRSAVVCKCASTRTLMR